MTVHLDTTQPPPHPPTLAEAHALIDLLWQVVGQLQRVRLFFYDGGLPKINTL
jgi:hypothetical protein